MSLGVNLFSDYSGMGSFEQCSTQLEESMHHLGLNTGKGFKSITCCDNAAVPHTVLTSFSKASKCGPKHVLGTPGGL